MNLEAQRACGVCCGKESLPPPIGTFCVKMTRLLTYSIVRFPIIAQKLNDYAEK